MVKVVNKLQTAATKKENEEPAAPTPPSEDIVLLREIRDALAKRN